MKHVQHLSSFLNGLSKNKGMSLFYFNDSTTNCGSITILNSFFFPTLALASKTKSLQKVS